MRQVTYNEDDRQYLLMMQSNIERMAGNSANCKTWLVTILAGFLAIGCGVDALNGWLLLAVIPIFVFWGLDSYYLKLERGMRNRQHYFINNYGRDDVYGKALYDFKTLECRKDEKDKGYRSTEGVMWTTSEYPFYIGLLLVILFIMAVLNWDNILSIYK